MSRSGKHFEAIFLAIVLRARSVAQIKLRAREIGGLERHLLPTLLSTLKIFLSVEITLEATIQNKFSKSMKFSREISVVEFCYSQTLVFMVI